MSKDVIVDTIQKWFDSKRDFLEGVSIYARFGRSWNQTQFLYKYGPTDKNRKTLEYELGRLLKLYK